VPNPGMAKRRRINARGARTIELPFLASCAMHLLDRRYWILGIRYSWYGIEFDLVVRDPALNAHVVLVEAKFRRGGRSIRPSEIVRFRDRLQKASVSGSSYYGRGFFMTNSKFSTRALDLCKEYGIRPFPEVPLIFESRVVRDHAQEGSMGLGSRKGGLSGDHSH